MGEGVRGASVGVDAGVVPPDTTAQPSCTALATRRMLAGCNGPIVRTVVTCAVPCIDDSVHHECAPSCTAQVLSDLRTSLPHTSYPNPHPTPARAPQVCRATDRFDCVTLHGEKFGRRGNISGGYLPPTRSKMGMFRQLVAVRKEVRCWGRCWSWGTVNQRLGL